MKDEKQIELSFIKKLEELKYVYREDIKDKKKWRTAGQSILIILMF